MIKQGTNLLRKRAFNISNHLVNRVVQQKNPQFSILNQQFNAKAPLNLESLSKEQYVNTVRGLNKIISSDVSITPNAYSMIDDLIANQRRQYPKDALPKEMLVTLLESIEHYYSFYSITSKALERDKKDGIIDNIEEMKTFAISNLLKWSHLNGILLKAIYQEWFSLDDMKSLLSQVRMEIEIEGKDIVLHDQVNYYFALIIFYVNDCWNVKHHPTRDTLIGLASSIFFYLPIESKTELVVSKIQQFVDMYPIVKELYTNPYEGYVEKSWKTVYSEDKFDWYLDLETDLPIHLGGLNNIFKELLKMFETKSAEHLVELLKEESLRAPNNPYIPHIKLCIVKDPASIDECLNVLEKSNSQSRFEELKRIELFGIFNNQKISQPRIKDFKFFPMLALKVKNLQGNSRLLLEQVECYSRLPTHVDLICIKFEASIREGRLEEALQNYQSLSYFENSISPHLMLRLTFLAARPMIIMGFHNECIGVIERFKNKYTSDPTWVELLQLAKEEIETVSKSK